MEVCYHCINHLKLKTRINIETCITICMLKFAAYCSLFKRTDRSRPDSNNPSSIFLRLPDLSDNIFRNIKSLMFHLMMFNILRFYRSERPNTNVKCNINSTDTLRIQFSDKLFSKVQACGGSRYCPVFSFTYFLLPYLLHPR